MKQLFIPELGTEIKLTEDWKFNLYAEKRNDSLFDYFNINQISINYYYRNIYLLSIKNLSEYKNKFNDLLKSLYVEFPIRPYYKQNDKKEHEEYKKKWNEFHIKSKENIQILINKVDEIVDDDVYVNGIEVTIPKDSILIIDRIYVRQNKEQFSSVSFYWKDKPLGKGFKKYIRFWAKLEDVNKIKFE